MPRSTNPTVVTLAIDHRRELVSRRRPRQARGFAPWSPDLGPARPYPDTPASKLAVARRIVAEGHDRDPETRGNPRGGRGRIQPACRRG